MTSHRGLKFQNSEFFPSERIFWTKVCYSSWFRYFHHQLYMIHKIESFWPISEMMISQHGAKMRENSFINEYLTSKFLLLLIFIFIIISTWVKSGPLFRIDFKVLKEQFHKRIIHLKVPINFDFHMSINIGTWNTNMDPLDPFLGWLRHHGESKR